MAVNRLFGYKYDGTDSNNHDRVIRVFEDIVTRTSVVPPASVPSSGVGWVQIGRQRRLGERALQKGDDAVANLRANPGRAAAAPI